MPLLAPLMIARRPLWLGMSSWVQFWVLMMFVL